MQDTNQCPVLSNHTFPHRKKQSLEKKKKLPVLKKPTPILLHLGEKLTPTFHPINFKEDRENNIIPLPLSKIVIPFPRNQQK